MLVRAYGKVNLDLRVLGTRADGYHELRTVFQSIALHDTLLCVPRPGDFTLQSRAAGVPLDESNLVWKAAAALWSALDRPGQPRDVAVTIKKQIPLEAGLGGGSANAAAALRALARLWGGAPISLLRDVAGSIGADVPYFLSGGTALGLGRGDEVYPLVDLPTHWVVIVRPPYGISTAEAYAWYDEDRAAGLQGAARAAAAAGAVADQGGADGQRPGAAGRAAPSRDWRAEEPVAGSGGGGGGDVGQRLGGIRAVSQPGGGGARAEAVVARRRPGAPDEDLEPRRARAPGSSGCDDCAFGINLIPLWTARGRPPSACARDVPAGRPTGVGSPQENPWTSKQWGVAKR